MPEVVPVENTRIATLSYIVSKGWSNPMVYPLPPDVLSNAGWPTKDTDNYCPTQQLIQSTWGNIILSGELVNKEKDKLVLETKIVDKSTTIPRYVIEVVLAITRNSGSWYVRLPGGGQTIEYHHTMGSTTTISVAGADTKSDLYGTYVIVGPGGLAYPGFNVNSSTVFVKQISNLYKYTYNF